MKIGTRLIIAFSSIVVFVVILGLYSLMELRTLNENGNVIYEKTTVPLGLLVKTADLEQEMRLQVREWKIGKTDEEREAAIKILDEDNAILKRLIAEQKERSIQEEVRILLDSLMSVADRYVAEAHTYVNSNTVRMACGMTEADIPKSLLDAGRELRKAATVVIEVETIAAKEVSKKNSQIANRAIKITLIIFVIAGFVSISFGTHLTLHITKALKATVNTVFKIEKGDTTARSNLELKDEFGMLSKSVDSLAFNLQNIIKNLRMDSDSLAGSAEELSVVSNQLVNIAGESLEQSITVTSTTEQVFANINKMAKDAEKTSVNTDNVVGEMEMVSTNVKEMTKIADDAYSSVGTMVDIAKQMSANMSIIVNTTKEMKTITDQMMDNTNETHKIAGNAISIFRKVTETLSNLGTEITEIGNAIRANNAASRIDGTRASVDEVVKVINNVFGIVVKINEKIELVSSQMSLQVQTGNEIVRGIELADTGAKRVDEYISRIAKVGKEVSKNALRVSLSIERISKSISEIANSGRSIAHSAEIASKGTKLVSYNASDMNRASNNGVQGAKQVSKNANELARIASNLKSVVDRFEV